MIRVDIVTIVHVLSDRSLHLQDSKRRAIASRFADELVANNPRFDRERFYRACGVES